MIVPVLRRYPCLLVFALMAFAAGGAAFGATSALTAADLMAAQSRRFEQLRSFSATSTRVRIYGKSVPERDWDVSQGADRINGKSNSSVQTTRFSLKGDFYLSSWESVRTGVGADRRDTAFDGTYQDFYPDARELVVRKKPRGSKREPYYVPPAALDPYEFALFDLERPRTFEVLQDAATWERLSEFAVIVGEEAVDGHPCAAVDIEIPGNERGGTPVMSRVYFAKDLGYFPVKTEQYQADSGYLYYRYVAWDVSNVGDPDGEGFYVNRMGLGRSWNWSGNGEIVAGFLTETDLESVAINPKLPDAMFTLPVAQARVYVNDLQPSLSFSPPCELERSDEIAGGVAATLEDAAPQETGDGAATVARHAAPPIAEPLHAPVVWRQYAGPLGLVAVGLVVALAGGIWLMARRGGGEGTR